MWQGPKKYELHLLILEMSTTVKETGVKSVATLLLQWGQEFTPEDNGLANISGHITERKSREKGSDTVAENKKLKKVGKQPPFSKIQESLKFKLILVIFSRVNLQK